MFEVRSEEFLARGGNTPFQGWKMRGKPVMAIGAGDVVWSL